MSLILHLHPLASYCWKPLVALYETKTPFEPHVVDLGDAEQREALRKLYPMVKFPVLVDSARNRTVPESSPIIEYLDLHYQSATAMIPRDAEGALAVRALDRFLDAYVHNSMQKVVGDRLRPSDKKDATGVDEARSTLATAYEILDRDLAGKEWACGSAFTLADCSACPALYYANRVALIPASRPNVAGYLRRLEQRPSFARVLREAQPYFKLFPE
jgi:glutathione S-transferase